MRIVKGNRSRRKQRIKGPVQVVEAEAYEDMAVNARLELIQALIPLGLMAVSDELNREVLGLAGPRYRHDGGTIRRHGHNPGSVKLMGQTVPMSVPRLRGPDGEIPLTSYRQLHEGTPSNETLLKRVLYGISCRNYEAAAEAIPGAIGLSKSQVSREFVEASRETLKSFQERPLSGLDIVAVFLDGKTFAEDELVMALGITVEGTKVLLGFVQTATENEHAVGEFLQGLLDRGLSIAQGILAVVDGSRGLLSAVKRAFRYKVLIQRCQWHKRENIVSYLPQSEQSFWRKKLQRAYDRPTYPEARRDLLAIRDALAEHNQSAMLSLDEGFEETLTLHRLDVFRFMGRSLKTTNCLESINAMVEERCAKVDYWSSSEQKQRWCAAALLDIEPRLRRVHGHRHLPKLRAALVQHLKLNSAEATSPPLKQAA